jgi:2-phosphoglycerate kinase
MWDNSSMKKITLIGGAPISGKTTLSKKIANENDAIELSTDSIRSWMKALVSKAEYPGLFYSDNMTAEQFYVKFDTAQLVVEGEITEGIQVEKGITEFLHSSLTWDHLVIEGIALSPSFMRKLEEQFTDIVFELFIMADEDENRIFERISKRGLWGTLETYPSSLITREVEWVVLYNKWFIKQAKKFNIDIKYN